MKIDKYCGKSPAQFEAENSGNISKNYCIVCPNRFVSQSGTYSMTVRACLLLFSPVPKNNLEYSHYFWVLFFFGFFLFGFRFMHELQNALKCSEKQLKPNQFSSDGHQRQEMPCSHTHDWHTHTCWGVNFKYLMPLSYQHPSGNHKCGRDCGLGRGTGRHRRSRPTFSSKT